MKGKQKNSFFIYFVTCGDYLKVGFTRFPEQRKQAFILHCPPSARFEVVRGFSCMDEALLCERTVLNKAKLAGEYRSSEWVMATFTKRAKTIISKFKKGEKIWNRGRSPG